MLCPSTTGAHAKPIPAQAGIQNAGQERIDLQIDKFVKPNDKMKQYYIYILASKRNGTLYIDVTNNLARRVYEHRNNLVEGFTSKYNVHKLVYYEYTQDVISAITREKQLKKWNREWKIRLIEEKNPDWRDLYDEIIS